jgi:glycosyltransferase involved in cell wall biosynthesis
VYHQFGDGLRKKVQHFQPSLVHVMYGGVMAEVVTRTVGDLPIVVSFCGSDLLGERLSRTDRRLMAWVGVLASRRAARRADGLIVKSQNLENALPVDVSRQKVRIIPNGVDLNRFKPRDRDECRASLGWEKSAFHVVFPANSGNAVKRPWLAQRAVDRIVTGGKGAQLHHLSGIPHKLVPVWLNAADAVLVTSRHEGSANIIKEALACDVPVVSVDVGDARERLAGVEGCHIAESDPASIAEKLLLVRAQPGRVNGRAAIAELTLERVAIRIRDFYEQVLTLPMRESLFRRPGRGQSSVGAVERSGAF